MQRTRKSNAKLIQEAFEALEVNQKKSALKSASLVLKSASNAEEFNAAGYIAFQGGDHSLAERAFSRAIQRWPSKIDAYNNLAIVLRYKGKLDSAISYLNASLKIKPDQCSALINLALTLLEQGRLDLAEEKIQNAIDCEPENPAAYNAYGEILVATEHFDAAEVNFLKAHAIEPSLNSSIANIMALYERRHKLDEACEFVNRVGKDVFQVPDLVLVYAKYLAQAGEKLGAIEILKKHLPDLRGSLAGIHAAYQISKLQAQLENIGEAFAYAAEANASIRDLYSWTQRDSALFKFISTLEKQIDHLPVRKGNRLISGRNKTPIFLVGFPRSGTTLVEQILGAHSSVVTIDERPMSQKMTKVLLEGGALNLDAVFKMSDEMRDRLASVYWAEAERYCTVSGDQLIVDKNPINTIYAPILWSVFPDAKFLYIKRTPIDAMMSCFLQNFEPTDFLMNFTALDSTILIYEKFERIWNSFTTKEHPCALKVDYECLVADFTGVTKEIIDFLGLKWEPNVERYWEFAQTKSMIHTPSYDQVIKPLFKNSIGSGQKYMEFLPEDIKDKISKY